MDRSIIYSMEQPRSFDFSSSEHDVLIGLASLGQDILGVTTTVISGLVGTQTTVPSLTINLSAGRVYQQAPADAVAIGSILQDTSVITQQGAYAASQIILTTTGIGAGQSRWSLVQAQFSQVDQVRSGDPNGGVMPFYNAADPAMPLNGQGGSGLPIPTERRGVCILQVLNGTPATTGAEVPPTVTAGWVPLYLIDLTNGQTAITTSQIITAGPSVGVGVPNTYPYAPFLAGLLNSHHSGNPGQAPKVNLATEVQGALPGSMVTGIPTVRQFTSGSPPGSDLTMNIGDIVVQVFSAVSSLPLHIATSPGIYRLTMVVSSTNTTDANLHLRPNNTTVTNAFSAWSISAADLVITAFGNATTSPSAVPITASPYVLSPNTAFSNVAYQTLSDFYFDIFMGPNVGDTINDIGLYQLDLVCSTSTLGKTVKASAGIAGGPMIGYAKWNDTTTPWTSLGTLVDSGASSISGFVTVQRLA